MTKRRRGASMGLGPPEGEQWIWMTKVMLGSITFRALGIHASRILDFLMHEHVGHGGVENGKLAAPYLQLEPWGVTEADVPKGLAELIVTGFVRRTHRGLRQAGGGEPSRYALTWLPTLAGTALAEKPTHDWQAVLNGLGQDGIGTVREARAWLKAEVGRQRVGRGATAHVRKAQKATPQMQVISPLKCGASGQ